MGFSFPYEATCKFIMIKLATPPGANITISIKIKPRYSNHALVNSLNSTKAKTIKIPPKMGPKKNVAPPKKVNSK